MTLLVATVFALVYAGMLLGGFPRLKIDRTGIALLGAICLLAGGALDLHGAGQTIDFQTLALLFGLMVVSAQLRLAGFYTRSARALASPTLSPPALLAVQVLAVGLLSAVFSNDIVCLAVATVWIDVCRRRGLDPLPYLLALPCAANVGSAATLIGNPQNMLIGESLRLSFTGYLARAGPPSLLGLGVVWGVVTWQGRGRWQLPDPGRASRDGGAGPSPEPSPPFDRVQAGKGLLVVTGLLLVFLLTPWPRATTALAGGGILLLSRRFHSRQLLELVDWPLLLLFIGLFVVNGAMEQTPLPARALAGLRAAGLDPAHAPALFVLGAVLSNLVSNVPAVILLLHLTGRAADGPTLALASTLAGNLLLVGSIANLIVAESARRRGIAMDWRRHARTGVPVTLLTLAIAAAWLASTAPHGRVGASPVSAAERARPTGAPAFPFPKASPAALLLRVPTSRTV